MLIEFRRDCHHHWDEEKIRKCCPEPKPVCPDPPSSDCCFDIWTWELHEVNIKLKDVDYQLNDEQKHLTVVETRYTRLKTWHEELTKASDLAMALCKQLEIVEGQLSSICKNACFTVKAVEVLYCMIREFYYMLDQLQERYDHIMHCIKCMNNPNLTTTQGIGKVLTDYGTALNNVVQTRTALIPLIMKAVDGAVKLHEELCDDCGYRELIAQCIASLHCGIPCGKDEDDEGRDHDRPLKTVAVADWRGVGREEDDDEDDDKGHGEEHDEEHDDEHGEEHGEDYCLSPMLTFPICNDPYTTLIWELYELEKIELHALRKIVADLTKEKANLTAVQQSLTKALKAVTPS
jgi:hypothetical protein